MLWSGQVTAEYENAALFVPIATVRIYARRQAASLISAPDGERLSETQNPGGGIFQPGKTGKGAKNAWNQHVRLGQASLSVEAQDGPEAKLQFTSSLHRGQG